jgi:hypothetical protein
VISGELREVISYRRSAPRASNQPPGTESIGAEYYDRTGRKVCYAHYYWLPATRAVNGWRIGGSGVPEAKMVYWDGFLFVAEP